MKVYQITIKKIKQRVLSVLKFNFQVLTEIDTNLENLACDFGKKSIFNKKSPKIKHLRRTPDLFSHGNRIRMYLVRDVKIRDFRARKHLSVFMLNIGFTC